MHLQTVLVDVNAGAVAVAVGIEFLFSGLKPFVEPSALVSLVVFKKRY